MNFSNKNFIIIGGTSGMGLAAAKALNIGGAKVLALGLDKISCEQASQELDEDCIIMQADASAVETVDLAIGKLHEKFGQISGLFHVAGGSGRKYGDGPLDQMSLEAWNKTFELNLTSIMLSNKAMINYFLKNNYSGSILNMGSVLGYSPSPKYFATHAYASAKAAVIGFSKSIAAYYAPNNISINVLAPGLFETPMAKRAVANEQIASFIKTKQPLGKGRFGQVEDIIEAVLLFMSPNSKFITGQVLAVDGGWSVSEGQY